jgi:hypothetical protein
MNILINSTSTNFGPAGQWVYINGEGFVIDGTTVLLNDQPVENLKVYHEGLIAFSNMNGSRNLNTFKLIKTIKP